MNAEILCVGTELVLGDILNTNAQYLSKQLALKGINVFYQSSVGDNVERIIKALSIAVSRSNLIIFTGGLGPTADDITIPTVSNALRLKLEKDDEAYRRMIEYFKKIGKQPAKNNEKQVYLPVGSTVFYNEKGTAPGCAIESGNQCIIFLPGPPSELQAMYENYVSEYLDKYSSGIIKSKFLHIYGVGESEIDERASKLIAWNNPTVAPYAKDGEVEIRVTAKSDNEADAENMINDAVLKIKNIFGDCIYGYDDDSLESVVVKLLESKNLTVATAESCTAGYISKRITDISGSSKIFSVGISTYSNESKTKELSVPAELIKEYGAVSENVAACMAKGIRLKSGADIGISITGIAGPKSDGSNKPVGLSYIGLSDKYGEYVIKSQKNPKKDREYIRYTSASEALNFLRLYLLGGEQNLQNAKKFNAVLIENSSSDSEASKHDADEAKKDLKISEENTEQTKNNIKGSKAKLPPRILNVQNSAVLPIDNSMINDVEEDENIVSEAVPINQMESRLQKEKKSRDIKILIDESEYTPVEDDEFKEMDEELKKFEQELVNQHKKKKFLGNILIHKGDSKKEIARKLIFFVALIIFIATLGNILYYYINPVLQERKLSNLASDYNSYSAESNYYSDKINPKFLSLYNKNKDIIGWINISGTNIDYPVLRSSESDDFYLRKAFDKSYSREGSIFADSKSSIKFRKESQNIMLYGHHMDSTGTMFKELDNYLDIDFYKNNPNITFDTLYRDGDYKVFAVFITNALKSQDNGNYFNYTKSDFSTHEEFLSWINEAKLRSIIKTQINVKSDDEILTLQTCNNSFESDGEKARLIIMARRIRDNEEKDTDTSGALRNPNPKYPQIWYDVHQQVNPYFKTNETDS